MTAQTPIPDYDAARLAMVDGQLRPQGVNDRLVLNAMAAVPREQFVPEDLRPLAYVDRSLPIGDGRMLAPATVLGLLLTQMLPEKGERALVVGAGTGYSAAVLQGIGVEVIALESSAALAAGSLGSRSSRGRSKPATRPARPTTSSSSTARSKPCPMRWSPSLATAVASVPPSSTGESLG
jgi:hypothetical protein